MLKHTVRLEAKVGEKDYHLICDSDSPLTDVKNALLQLVNYVDKVLEAAEEQQEQLQKEKQHADQP